VPQTPRASDGHLRAIPVVVNAQNLVTADIDRFRL
jgi:hypothetical protein